METVIVERHFDNAVTKEILDDLARNAASCYELHNVTWKASYLSRDRRRMVCIYEAPDAESVRMAQQMAKLPHERIYMTDDYAPPMP